MIFRVALDTPLRRLFDYLPPTADGNGPTPAPGMRVRVPFGRQRLVGIIVQVAENSEIPADRLKPILKVLDRVPVLEQGLLALIQWAAQYYHHPTGEVLASALPKALRLGSALRATEERWAITEPGVAAAQREEPRRA